MRAYRKANPQKYKAYAAKWHNTHPENRSVNKHRIDILGGKIPAYRGMPFFDGWNSAKGGSTKAGADWIISNLGRRPDKSYQLHVVDRKIGFMPGNLRWVPRSQHKQQELLAQVLLENQHLRNRLALFEARE
jgi:hypothetical protein